MKRKENEGLEIIELVTVLVENIKQYGLDSQRILIKENENNESIMVIESINRGAMINLTDYTTDTVGEVLKQLIRNLPDPIITCDLYLPLINLYKNTTLDLPTKCKKMGEILKKLPLHRSSLLTYLFDFFALLLLHKENNKIDANSLAVALGSGVLLPEIKTKENMMGRNFDYETIYSTLQFFMENFVAIFEKEITPPIKVSSNDILTRQVVANFKTPVTFNFHASTIQQHLNPAFIDKLDSQFKCHECNKFFKNGEICSKTSRYLFHLDCM